MVKNLKNKKKKKGFTLIELIIVIAIIAILAAIAIPKFGEIRRDANIKSDISNAKNIQSVAVTLLGENDLEADEDYIVGATDDPIEDAMQNVPETKLIKDGKFKVSITDTGDITVNILASDDADDAAGTQVYPKPSTGNNWYPAD